MLNFTSPSLAICEALLRILYFDCNAVEVHAPQSATYGKVAEALIEALSNSVREATGSNRIAADAIARRLYEEAIDNGEDIAWQISLFNNGVIEV